MAIRPPRFPLARLQLRELARLSAGVAVVSRAIESLPIQAHAGADDEPLNRLLDQCLQQIGRSGIIHRSIISYLVHALADSDQRREMEHRVHILQSLFQSLS